MMAHDPREADDDPWLDALGALARDEREEIADAIPSDGPFQALDAEERGVIVAAIRAERARERAREEAEAADAFAAHEVDAFAAHEADAFAAHEADAIADPHPADRHPADAALPLADLARPSLPRHFTRIAAVVLAIAAALAFIVLRPADSALPAYTLETTAGAQLVRGEEAPTPGIALYTAGTRFRFVLRPAAPPTAPVTATVAMQGPAGVIDWQPDIAIGANGGVKIEGIFAGPLALPPGTYTATFTVTAGDDSRTLEHAFQMMASASD